MFMIDNNGHIVVDEIESTSPIRVQLFAVAIDKRKAQQLTFQNVEQ